jgi:hypothetical protein
MAWQNFGLWQSKNFASGLSLTDFFRSASHFYFLQETTMKLRQLALAVTVAAAGLSSALVSTVATAQTKEQFFPVLVYRTGS